MANEPKMKLALVNELPENPARGTVYISPDTSGNFVKVGVDGSVRTIFDGSNYVLKSESPWAPGEGQGSAKLKGGTNVEALGAGSIAHGINITAVGANSHAEGFNVQANNEFEHAQGTYNISRDGTLFSIGTGLADARRENIIEVCNNSLYIKNVGNFDGSTLNTETKTVAQVLDLNPLEEYDYDYIFNGTLST